MPYKIRKKNNKYQVRSPRGIRAKGTTLRKAKAQIRLLRRIKTGWRPSSGRKKKMKTHSFSKKDINRRKKELAAFDTRLFFER